jgi:broad specificity phosphatase PhoE
MGPFDRVVTSELPRALETAVAMGFAVGEQCAALNTIEDQAAVDAEVDLAKASFAELARAAARGGALARLGRRQSEAWLRLAASIPEGGRLLIVAHGGLIEPGAAVALPDEDFAAWGPNLRFCEGVRLSVDGRAILAGQPLRVRSEQPSRSRSPTKRRGALPTAGRKRKGAKR